MLKKLKHFSTADDSNSKKLHKLQLRHVFFDLLDTSSETEGEGSASSSSQKIHQDTRQAVYQQAVNQQAAHRQPIDLNSYARRLDLITTTTSDPMTQLNRKYQRVVKSRDTSSPLVVNPRYTVSNESLKRLRPGTWLNDELINAYVSLVNTRLA